MAWFLLKEKLDKYDIISLIFSVIGMLFINDPFGGFKSS
jgi:drug/metabolite transporter (DMT)-like permease